MLWKQIGLLYLIVCTLRTRFDLGLFVAVVLLGSTYIGYEVVVNGRGHFTGSRLEGIGAPGASEANYLAGLLSFAIPLAGYWLFFGNRWQKVFSIPALILGLEVILRCNSRGTFLALLAAGGWLLIVSSGRTRRYALVGVVLGCLTFTTMARDERILQRFFSTFTSTGERDTASAGRLQFWTAALGMLVEHPVGSGGEAAFKSNLGASYIRDLGQGNFRAVHNGYLDIAVAWGMQGFLLYAATIFLAWRLARNTRLAAMKRQDNQIGFFAASLEAALVSQLVVCLFISSLDGEWFFWWFALSIGLDRVYGLDAQLAASTSPMHSESMPELAHSTTGESGQIPYRYGWRPSISPEEGLNR